jgi:hypothetical protein
VSTTALRFPNCSETETRILQMRAQGKNFREISLVVGLSPRKTSDTYFRAMRKVIEYLETSLFLQGGTK